MVGSLKSSAVFVLFVGLFAAAISVAAGVQSGAMHYYVAAGAFVCIGVGGYRRPLPFTVPFREMVAYARSRRPDTLSVVGLVLLFASLIARYAFVPAA
jgi:hypothetical protein